MQNKQKLANNQAQPNIFQKLYKQVKLISKNANGQVVLVKNIKENQFYIAKKLVMNKESDKSNENQLNELQIIKTLKHPNIVSYKDSFFLDNELVIIMECCEEGDLQKHIKIMKKKGKQFNQTVILNWFIQIVMALEFIHTKKIMHRDLKTSNIFLSKCGSVKIGDFGISKQLQGTQDQTKTLLGTPYYLSPELCQNQPYSIKSDIWSLGTILFELCFLDHPFQAKNLLQLCSQIINDEPPEIPEIYDTRINILIGKLLNKDPLKRPQCREILTDSFMVEVMSNFFNNKGYNMGSLFIEQNQIKKKQEKWQMPWNALHEKGKGLEESELTKREKDLQQKILEIQKEMSEIKNSQEKSQEKEFESEVLNNKQDLRNKKLEGLTLKENQYDQLLKNLQKEYKSQVESQEDDQSIQSEKDKKSRIIFSTDIEQNCSEVYKSLFKNKEQQNENNLKQLNEILGTVQQSQKFLQNSSQLKNNNQIQEQDEAFSNQFQTTINSDYCKTINSINSEINQKEQNSNSEINSQSNQKNRKEKCYGSNDLEVPENIQEMQQNEYVNEFDDQVQDPDYKYENNEIQMSKTKTQEIKNMQISNETQENQSHLGQCLQENIFSKFKNFQGNQNSTTSQEISFQITGNQEDLDEMKISGDEFQQKQVNQFQNEQHFNSTNGDCSFNISQTLDPNQVQKLGYKTFKNTLRDTQKNKMTQSHNSSNNNNINEHLNSEQSQLSFLKSLNNKKFNIKNENNQSDDEIEEREDFDEEFQEDSEFENIQKKEQERLMAKALEELDNVLGVYQQALIENDQNLELNESHDIKTMSQSLKNPLLLLSEIKEMTEENFGYSTVKARKEEKF